METQTIKIDKTNRGEITHGRYIFPLIDHTLYDENEIGYAKKQPTLREVIDKVNEIIDVLNEYNKKI